MGRKRRFTRLENRAIDDVRLKRSDISVLLAVRRFEHDPSTPSERLCKAARVPIDEFWNCVRRLRHYQYL